MKEEKPLREMSFKEVIIDTFKWKNFRWIVLVMCVLVFFSIIEVVV